ncbi:MAG: DUF2188 domain-containing protein [Albidovulum sp.]|nr:DUF2188 domain-containing protein [Albidovulum sp.]
MRRSGSDIFAKIFDTQKQAVAVARGIAPSQDAEHYIHGRDGRIRDQDSCGNDPLPPEG